MAITGEQQGSRSKRLASRDRSRSVSSGVGRETTTERSRSNSPRHKRGSQTTKMRKSQSPNHKTKTCETGAEIGLSSANKRNGAQPPLSPAWIAQKPPSATCMRYTINTTDAPRPQPTPWAIEVDHAPTSRGSQVRGGHGFSGASTTD